MPPQPHEFQTSSFLKTEVLTGNLLKERGVEWFSYYTNESKESLKLTTQINLLCNFSCSSAFDYTMKIIFPDN
jgi:hypothetical protein